MNQVINAMRKRVCDANQSLPKHGLVKFTWGNVSAWHNDVYSEFYLGHHAIAALHLKDTYAVTESSKGQFRDVPFGEGCVNWEEAFDILKQTNYNGPFLIEMWSENCETVEETRAAIQEAQAFLYPLIKKAGLM